MTDGRSRRDLLAALGAGVATASAGCLSALTAANSEDSSPRDRNASIRDESGDSGPTEQVGQEVGTGRYAEVYREAVDSVAFLAISGPRGRGGGSGFVFEDDYLVTNHHVVERADGIDVQFAGDDWTTAEVVGSDPHSDLAVVRVEDRPEYATSLPVAAEDPEIGQEVMALGNPLGYDSSVTKGIVSGLNRSLPAPTGFSIANAVQTDAPINPGNSGGPLVDMDAEVVAVVTAGAGEGIGFGISAAMVRKVVPELVRTGEFDHSYVGITTVEVTPTVADANDLEEISGVLVDDVLDGTPADGVLEPSEGSEIADGLRVPVGGDVIRSIDGTRIGSRNDLSTYLALETDPEDTVDVVVLRDGRETTVELTLGSRSEHSIR